MQLTSTGAPAMQSQSATFYFGLNGTVHNVTAALYTCIYYSNVLSSAENVSILLEINCNTIQYIDTSKPQP